MRPRTFPLFCMLIGAIDAPPNLYKR